MKIRSFLISVIVLTFILVSETDGKKDNKENNVNKGKNKLPQVQKSANSGTESRKQLDNDFSSFSYFKVKASPSASSSTTTQTTVHSSSTQHRAPGMKSMAGVVALTAGKTTQSGTDSSSKIDVTSPLSASSTTTTIQPEPSPSNPQEGGSKLTNIIAMYPANSNSFSSMYMMYTMHRDRQSSLTEQVQSTSVSPTPTSVNDSLNTKQDEDGTIGQNISSQDIQPSTINQTIVLQPTSTLNISNVVNGTVTYSSVSVNLSAAVKKLLAGDMNNTQSKDSNNVDSHFCNNQSILYQPVALNQTSSTASPVQLPIVTSQSDQKIGVNASNNVAFINNNNSGINSSNAEQSSKPCTNISSYTISNDEIKKLSEKLFELDKNNGYKYITVNPQNETKRDRITDDALAPLLVVKPEAYEIPTIKSLSTLYDNYELDVKTKKTAIPEDHKKESELLDAFSETDVFKETIKFLTDKKFLSNDIREFKDSLKRIWFTQFKRAEGEPSSSGFETLFLAENNYIDNYMIGPQNWIYYAKQEAQKKLDYRGYIKNVKLGEKAEAIKIRTAFNISDTKQSITTLLVGLSPELEMALHTVCFYTRPNDVCPISLSGREIILVSVRFNYFDKDIMISSFVAG